LKKERTQVLTTYVATLFTNIRLLDRLSINF
jgi:hypothetical protein